MTSFHFSFALKFTKYQANCLLQWLWFVAQFSAGRQGMTYRKMDAINTLNNVYIHQKPSQLEILLPSHKILSSTYEIKYLLL